LRVPHPLRQLVRAAAIACLCLPVAVDVAGAKTNPKGSGGASAGSTSSGGAGITGPPAPISTPLHPMVAGSTARIIHGLAYAPSNAPIQVQRAIWAGDRIRHKPYLYAGGHGRWNDVGYDCSGTVSYVLHAAGLLSVSMDSTQFLSWGKRGLGQWITVYTNPGHAFIDIAGIRLDTSSAGDPNPFPVGEGPRWRPLLADTSGFVARHPAGL
jgi:hypothetical protein